MPATPRTPEAPDLDLPELDKADDSAEVDVGSFELSLGEELSLDEGEGTVDAFEIGIEEQDVPGSDEAAVDLEIGMADLLGSLPEEPPPGRDSDAPPAPDGDLDLHLDTPLDSDDTSTDEELGDDGLEPLPELMADDPDGESGPELERAFLPGAPEGRIPPGTPLEVEWLELGAPVTALWAGNGDVLAAAEKLMRFGHERRSDALPIGASATSVTADSAGNAILATARGLVEVTPSGSSSVLEAPEPVRGSGADVAELCGTLGGRTLWARLTSGALLRRRSGTWERHEAGGEVRSVTGSQEQVALLVLAGRPTLQLSIDGGSSFRERLLPEPAATVALGVSPVAMAYGNVLVVSDVERGLCVSSDGGETFTMVTGAVNVTALTLGEWHGSPCLFAALHREGRDVSQVISVDPTSAAALGVAELSGEPDEDSEETGRTAALILADGYLWAAGSYGLARLR